MRVNHFPWVLTLGGAIVLGTACGGGDSSGPSPVSSLRVIVQTEGTPYPSEGYLVQVDGAAPKSLAPNDTVLIDGLASGSHYVFLSRIAPTCWPDLDNMELVTLSPGATVTWNRRIQCEDLPPPLVGKIAFTRMDTPGGSAEILIMSVDGSAQSNLTQNPAWDYGASISPDGHFLAFTSDRTQPAGIYRMRSDGHGATRISPPQSAWPYLGNWSPDGKRLVFTGSPGALASVLYSVNVDGTGLVQLTPSDNDAFSPAWSPDGQKIAFCRSDTPGAAQIYVLYLQSSITFRLTTTPRSWQFGPDWSPDGEWIAFASELGISVMRKDGSAITQLTHGSHGPAIWSPDGRHIAYSSQGQVYVMNPDGTAQVNISLNQWDDIVSDWSP